MKIIELFWLFMTIFISLIFVTNYENLALREKILYLVALLLSTFLYSFRRHSRLIQNRSSEDSNSNTNENQSINND